jgi:excisionase family DNA binding protein
MPKTVPIEPGFLKVEQIARELNVSDKHVRRLIARGELASHRFGDVVRVARKTLDQYIERSRR